MDLGTVLLILGGLVLVSTVIGVAVKATEGRVKKVNKLTQLTTEELGENLTFGSGATLLQFSTEFCTKCPGTRTYLSNVASQHPGVSHVDVDITHRPDIAQKYNILQTPTTFILDDHGILAARIGGSPRPEAVSAGLEIALRRDHDSYVI